MNRPRAFIEAPAGLASVSLRLHGGANCRPPISRMGSKVGFSHCVLGALGLQSGQGASAFCWAESDPDVRALLRAYPDPEMLRRIAEIIRGWAGEEPRALWERLRAERKARGPAVDAEGAAGWIQIQATSWPHGPFDPIKAGLGGVDSKGREWGTDNHWWAADRCHRLAEYAQIQSGNRLVNMAGPDLMNTGNGGTRFGGEFATPAGDVAGRFEEVARGVAEASYLHQGSFQYKGAEAGIGRPEGMDAHDTHGAIRPVAAILGDAFPRIASSGWPPVLVLPAIPTAADVAAWLGTPGDLEGVVVYSDPPYVGTTGYRDVLPRADVVRHALDFAALGAVVCVSESVPVEELTALGWHSTDITGGRKGQRRTFARVATEALTMNREPIHRVAVQTSMFGGAA